MKKSMLILLVMFLMSACEDMENPQKIGENPPVQTTAVSTTASTEISEITTAETAVIQEKTTTATDFEDPVEFQIETEFFEETTAGFPEIQPKTESQTTVTVSENAEEKETVESVAAAAATEAKVEEIPDIPQKSDYDRALEVYNFMCKNGSGTCVNFACQTYKMCTEIGLPYYIVWTENQLCGHVANTVKIGDIWYILDVQGGFFLDCNYGFTEVVDIDGNHIADGDILSNYSYDELN
ncbi:MAG: hypothetical protein NC093_11175 [Alistipes sp.]|nr:hypothetical protein [Alistipes sp.]